MITTTLADLYDAGFYAAGIDKIRIRLGVNPNDAKTHRDPFPVAILLETSGFDGTLWVLDYVIADKWLNRLIAADFAERVLPIFEREYPGDPRPRRAIEAVRNPDATNDELEAAARDAERAARDADAAARSAARSAAWAAQAAAWAAQTAAWAATRSAQTARLRQYLEHGPAAADMPWPEESK